MNPPTIHWHCTGRIGSCLGYGPPTQGRAPFRLEAVLGCWTGLGTLDRNFPSFALSGPKHQTNRARNFCSPSRTTVAQFRHMAQGPPLHWLRPGKAVVCPPVAPPLDSVPDALRHSQLSDVLVTSVDRVLLNPARTSRVFSIRHPPPSSTSLPEATSLRCGSFNANITGSKFPSDQMVPMYHWNLRPGPQRVCLTTPCELLANLSSFTCTLSPEVSLRQRQYQCQCQYLARGRIPNFGRRPSQLGPVSQSIENSSDRQAACSVAGYTASLGLL